MGIHTRPSRWLTFALVAALGVRGLPRKVLVLQASMPVGVLNYLFAERYGRSPHRVAGLVLVSTLMSLVSIPFVLYLLGA